ncbi:MAG: hypothetical protein EAZ20_07325 [Bacteroidetes bacterium]|nr:MAG: hypothetical protein EAZ20_07325 [Bacteroidota bacterium]
MMKNFILLFLFVFFYISNLSAQKKILDSLEKQEKIYTKEDTIKVKQYISISKLSLSESETAKAAEFIEKAITLAEKIKSQKLVSVALADKSYICFITGDLPQATRLAQKSINMAEEMKDENLMARNYQILGKIYEGQGKLNETLELYEKTLIIYKKSNNKINLSQIYNNLGNINAMLGKFEKAFQYQKQGLDIRKKLPKQFQGSLTYSYNDMAYIFGLQEKNKEALEYQLKALENAIKFQDDLYLNFGYLNIASSYLALNNVPKSLEFADKGLQYAKKLKAKQSITSCYNILTEIQKRLKNFEKALEYQELFVIYRDSVWSEKQQKELAKIENNYKFEKQKKENEILKKEQLIRDAKITQLIYAIVFTCVGVGLLVLLSVFLLRNNRLKQKNNEILLEKNEEINQQNEEIKQIAENLHEVNETVNEKNRLITEQNDNLLSNISYAQRIQETILPTKEYINQHLDEYFILFRPKDIVSGDFYFFQEVDGLLVFAAIDCTGHGVSGAFMTILANDILDNIINNQKIIQADLILNHLHKDIRKSLKQAESNNRDGMDMSLVVIDKKNKKIQFAGAKNSLIYIQNQTLTQIKGDRLPIGGEQKETERLFTLHTIEANIDTYLYLFSDGFQDQFGGENREKFMISRLKNLFLEIHQQKSQTQKQILNDTLENWIISSQHEAQIDDVLVVGLKI